jgi:hypothetical protein
MVNAGDVLSMLCPDAHVAIVGDKYEDIDWFGKDPAITKKQYEDGFGQYEAWKAKQEADRAVARQALLTRLGITEEEALLLLA